MAVTGGQIASARRVPWVDALVRVGAAVRRRRCLLLIDSTEWLYYFDDIRREQPRSGEPLGVGGWFIRQVLLPLLGAAPRLKVVLVGQERLALDHLPVAVWAACELGIWTPQHTAAYLIGMGLTDPGLAGLVHQESGGMPLLAWLLAQACQDRAANGHLADAAWLAAQARDRPLHEWFPAHVPGWVTGEQRELIQACAILRTVSQGALEVLMAGTKLSPGWLDGLRRHYLLEEVPTPGKARRWRMHAIIRSWLLDHLGRLDADRLPSQRELPAGIAGPPTTTNSSPTGLSRSKRPTTISLAATPHSTGCGATGWSALSVPATSTRRS